MGTVSVLTVILLIWFSFDLTGLRIGKFVLAESCFKDEPFDVIWWVIFLLATASSIIKPVWGRYLLLATLTLWLAVQYYFTFRYIIFPSSKKIKSYNDFFSNTHHVIPPSEKILVPDTYHIVLFCLIFADFSANIVILIT